MKLAFLGNHSSIGSLLAGELRRRGIEADVFGAHRLTNNNMHVYDLKNKKRLRMLYAWYKLMLRRYDVSISLGSDNRMVLSFGSVHSRRNIPYWQGAEAKERYRINPYTGVLTEEAFRPRGHSFYTTPDLSGEVLLPRPVNTTMFKRLRGERIRRVSGPIRLGHFWRRGNITQDYAIRWWKDSDRLFEALRILREKGYEIELRDGFIERYNIPTAYAGVDVYADQFRVGSYGIPALEALLTGTPVVCYLERKLCECPEMMDLVNVCSREPEDIARAIVAAYDAGAVDSTKPIEEFHSATRSVDILVESLSKWGCL